MTNPLLTKSDFLLFREAPLHLWAHLHGRFDETVSEFAQFLGRQGYEVEGLAHDYLLKVWLPSHPDQTLTWQPAFTGAGFIARVDALLTDLNGRIHLVEIKSSTNIEKDKIIDVAYQASVLQGQVEIDTYNLLHLNKDYLRSGALDLERLFLLDDVTDKVTPLLPEILGEREAVLAAASAESPEGLAACLKPGECRCPDLCHDGLPDFSIFDIPRISEKNKLSLLGMGVRAARDIPREFKLTEPPERVVEVARSGQPYAEVDTIRAELSALEFPLYFLDYESCQTELPEYDGYHPQQQVVFQYSLHRLDRPDAAPAHMGYISAETGEPSAALVERLACDLGPTGSVLVWNKTFEQTRNKEFGVIHPCYADFMTSLNNCIYDLMDIFTKGYYRHPGFRGSCSIKQVLPIMVPELSYKGLAINHGDQASIVWWNIVHGKYSSEEREENLRALWSYCELDTLAMVEIYKRLIAIAGMN